MKILVTPTSMAGGSSSPAMERLRAFADEIVFNPTGRPLTPEELLPLLRGCQGYIAGLDQITAYVLEGCPDLQVISRYGAGCDAVDIASARRLGITVTNTPGVLTEDTADMTMALILAVARRVAEGARIIPDDDWTTGWSPTWMLGRRITGKRLGIVGMGRIGQALAKRARAFGLQVHYHNRRRVPAAIEGALEATYWESLDQMLARVDIVSVNCPHTPATYHLLSARRLKLLKPEAIVVNTARGEVIDENALARLIESGDVSSAGLDVFDTEPLPADSPLRSATICTSFLS